MMTQREKDDLMVQTKKSEAEFRAGKGKLLRSLEDLREVEDPIL